jgi:tRNA (cmo5U34)-methyltransferase
MKTLGIDDFFYVPERSYDYLAEKALPFYHEAHKRLVASLDFDKNKEMRVIDLGIGSGVTSAYILKNFPKAHVIGVDLFDEMLEEAKHRLGIFKERVSFVKSDNSEFLKSFENKVDAVVSAFCIHHLDEEGKKNLFSLIHNILFPGGKFIMIDLTTFEDSYLKEQARQSTINNMMVNVKEEKYRKEWIHHWNNINIPSSSDKMIRWMIDIGFSAETAFKNYEVALIVASK